jgi:hypothetical protein
MATSNGIQVYIGASVADLVQGLKDGTTAVRNFGREAAGSRAGTDQAAGGFNSLGSSLMAFKREQVQQGRLVGFYVRELTEFTGISKQAQGVLSGLGSVLVEGLAGGVGIGLALEGIKLLVYATREWGTVSGEAAAKAKKGMEEFQASLKKSRDELQHQTFLAMGGTENQWMALQAQGKTIDQLGILKSKEVSVEAGIATARARFAEAQAADDAIAQRNIQTSIRARLQELQGLQDKIKAINTENAELMRNANLIDQIERSKDSGKNAAGRKDSGYQRDLSQWMKGERDYLPQAARMEQMASAADIRGGREETQRRAGMLSDEQKARLRQMQGFGGQGDNRTGTEVADRFAEERAQLKQTMTAWQNYGQVAGDAIGGIVTGQKSVGQAFAQIAQQVIGVVQQMVIKTVMAHAAGAAAGAAESQAAVPLIGPGLAIAAMAAMFAAVSAMVGQIGSAEGGWELPGSGGPFPMVGHPGERMLNKKQNRDYEDTQDLLRSGGAGGGSVTVHINAMDAKSFDGWAERGGDDHVIRLIRRAQRSGRI